MNLINRLRSAEQQSREAAVQGFSWARTSLEEAQSKIRRKMRIHPRTSKGPLMEASRPPLMPISAAAQPIISIHGKDVAPQELESPEPPARKAEKKAEEEQVA